jgi:exopolysaccharide biosynthesis protein
LSMGALEGMNLDGGGSSALWVRGEIVNFPSDPTGERAVGNALVVRERRP